MPAPCEPVGSLRRRGPSAAGRGQGGRSPPQVSRPCQREWRRRAGGALPWRRLRAGGRAPGRRAPREFLIVTLCTGRGRAGRRRVLLRRRPPCAARGGGLGVGRGLRGGGGRGADGEARPARDGGGGLVGVSGATRLRLRASARPTRGVGGGAGGGPRVLGRLDSSKCFI